MSLREQMTKRLSGTGLDIGALHRPMVKHSGMKVVYVDRLPAAELKKHSPELSEFPLVEADIISDAQYLPGIDSGKYDFVIASHLIEHMSCTLGALEAWFRVLKVGGLLYLVVPDKRYIFDKKRSLTTFEHILKDFQMLEAERHEADWQHCLEYAELVDDCEGAEIEEHAKYLRDSGYSYHPHTFIPESFHEVLIYFIEHVCPGNIEAGPRIDPTDKHEFHFLLRKE